MLRPATSLRFCRCAAAIAASAVAAACAGPGNDADPATDALTPDAATGRAGTVESSAPAPVSPGFVEFCERTLLVRRARTVGTSDALVAEGWFGGLVPLDDVGGFDRMLPELLVALYRVEDGSAAAPAPRSEAHWAVARMLALRGVLGAAAFRDGLREFVDRHRDGDPAGMNDLLAAMGDASGNGDVVSAFAGHWLQSPIGAVIEVSTRYDAARERVLLRVDQTHAVESGAPAAFPFGLELDVVHADGSEVRHRVEVEKRRHLFELNATEAPASVAYDPEGALRGLVRIEDGD